MTNYKPDAKDYGVASWPTKQWPELFADANTERGYVAANFQHMPEDWFPEGLMAVVKDGDNELACAFLPHHTPEMILNSIKALRRAVWQHKENERLHKEWLAMQKETQS